MIESDQSVSALSKSLEEGLSQKPKRLPSWLFYDEIGDKIFQSIMNMPEYYLTRCEYEILENNKATLQKIFTGESNSFNLIELGAGDGLKTEILLAHFSKNNTSFIYTPVDVSKHALDDLTARLLKNIPGLTVNPVNKRYDDALQSLHQNTSSNVFLFLGATIGNFTTADAINFAGRICSVMSGLDKLLIGFDLKKDPRLIQAAYDDPHGITRDFNINLLHRLNRDAGADFKMENFSHYPCYNPETGQNRSYLVSKTEQDVYIKDAETTIHFDSWEVIHTEISQKYDTRMIETFASEAGLKIIEWFFDSKKYFCDVLFTKA